MKTQSTGPLTAAARSVKWWFTSVMGDHDYARYVEHMRVKHPEMKVPCEREYWRARHADADANPGARCC
ncbi:YbdD/YjiX family protein [Antrihabitans stalactiti]|uniref:YbdD/YjiX family protein n=1 Tax=Antrihabitans stalactiti TaxID=2584121 RepID=A0A848KMP1_9NOCA|nr:YbdD/YjiX family protein [Antrihabitans stalactiti]NMN99208.1 YbdD/YjiX family protein [Antrihabitans stalactiti]